MMIYLKTFQQKIRNHSKSYLYFNKSFVGLNLWDLFQVIFKKIFVLQK